MIILAQLSPEMVRDVPAALVVIGALLWIFNEGKKAFSRREQTPPNGELQVSHDDLEFRVERIESQVNELHTQMANNYEALRRDGSARSKTIFDAIERQSVVISVNKQGVRQRFQGGTIVPTTRKFLAIPMTEEAYGEVPSKFADSLKVIRIPGKGTFLALKTPEPAKGEAAPEPTLYYRLVRKVKQAPNPNVLPSREQIATTAVEAIKEALE